jgi:hypothetical protein
MPPAARIASRLSLLPWLAYASIVLTSQAAQAQPLGETIVVPLGTELRAPLAAAGALEAALPPRQISLISFHDARDRFTTRSRPPQTASDSDVDVLAREAREAIEHVAFGRTVAAQKSVREVITRAERTLESLNRETATARQILDACLSLVRSTLQGGKRDLALEQATRCRRLVPDLVPSADAHPANVIGVLAEADSLLRRLRIGDLTVRSAPESSCAVYLNGRHLGTTPFHLDRAAAGEYRVQVECGRTLARVHVVQLGDQPASLLVDTQFDRAVESDPRLLLRYEKLEDAYRNAVSHAAQLGRGVQAEDVVLVSVDGTRAELLRVRVAEQRMIARARLPWTPGQGFQRAELERAITSLTEGRFEDGTGPTAFAREPAPEKAEQTPPTEARTEIAPDSEPESTSQASTPEPEPAASQVEISSAPPALEGARARPGTRRRALRWKRGLSGSVLALGAVSFTVAGALLRQRVDKGEELRLATRESYAPLVRAWDDTRAGPYVFAALGSAVATSGAIGLVLTLPELPSWAAVLSGAAGMALATWGIIDLARGAPCGATELNRRTCSDEFERRDRGAIVALAAVPLLAAPLTYLLTRTLRTRGLRAAAIELDTRGIAQRSLLLTGRFQF